MRAQTFVSARKLYLYLDIIMTSNDDDSKFQLGIILQNHPQFREIAIAEPDNRQIPRR